MDLQGLDLVAIVGDETWRTPGWPVALAVGNAAFAVALAVGLVVHSRFGGLGQRGAAWIVGALTLLLTGLGCAVPFALLPATLLSEQKYAVEVYWAPFAVELGASAVAMLAIGAGVSAWLYAPKTSVPLPVVPLLLAPVVIALALAGPGHIVALNAAGPLPTMDIALGPRVHVGSDTTIPVTLDDEAASGWLAPPVHVAPTTRGTFAVELKADRVGLSGLRVVTREAGEDRGSPLFPLADGNTWDLAETVMHEAHYLWFLNGNHENPGSTIHIVATAGPDRPLRTWLVSRADDGDPATTWTIYQWNGDLIDQATGQPFLQVGTDAADHLTGCSLEVLDGWTCACGRPPLPPAGTPKGWKNPWEIEGPARCDKTDSPGAVRTGLGALMALMSVGLIIDMGDATHTVVLTRSGRGGG